MANRASDDAFPCATVLKILITGYSHAAGVRDRGIEPGSVLRHARIVNDETASARSDQSSVGCSQTAPGARNDDNLTVKSDRLLC